MNLHYDSGIYLLQIFLQQKTEIKIGARGIQNFPSGYYYYCGSAQKNLQARLKRHLRDEKNYHWHIDYLLSSAMIESYYTWPVNGEAECKLAKQLEELGGKVIVPGFGASDCNCQTHLYYFTEPVSEIKNITFSHKECDSGGK